MKANFKILQNKIVYKFREKVKKMLLKHYG